MAKEKKTLPYMPYDAMIRMILEELAILRSDISAAVSGNFSASIRARVRTVRLTKLFKMYRERSTEETLAVRERRRERDRLK